MKKEPLIEIALENIEALIDSFIENDLLKSIPVVGTALKTIMGARDIRDRLFAAKLMTFLKALEEVKPELKEKIRQKVSKSSEEAQKVGETILLLIDRLDDLEKADIIAKLFVAYSYGHLNSRDFHRVAQAVDQAFSSELSVFLQTHNLPRKGPSQDYFMQSLYPSGLTKMLGGKTFKTAGEIFFEVSPLGNKLINGYNHGRKLSKKPSVKDTQHKDLP